MTTRELIEHAALDALGLLEGHDAERFEQAFNDAPPELQAMVRREQKRFADAERMLPDVQPPATLKPRVMSGVREAIAAETRRAAAGVVDSSATTRRLFWGSVVLWRAACIGFATATVVLGVFFSSAISQNRSISNELARQTSIDIGRQLPNIRQVLFDGTQYRFTPASNLALNGDSPFVGIMIDPNSGAALLVCENLPVLNGEYSLVFNPADGKEPEVLASFIASEGTLPVPVNMQSIDVAQVERLQIVGPPTEGAIDEVIMTLTVA